MKIITSFIFLALGTFLSAPATATGLVNYVNILQGTDYNRRFPMPTRHGRPESLR